MHITLQLVARARTNHAHTARASHLEQHARHTIAVLRVYNVQSYRVEPNDLATPEMGARVWEFMDQLVGVSSS